MLFEQALIDFKQLHPSNLPILIVVPVTGSSAVLADITTQLIHFSRIFGKSRVLISFGVDQRRSDDIYSQIHQTSEALLNSKILHNLRITKDLDEWTYSTLQGYIHDFEVAVVLRGIICANDLALLVINAFENDADLACSVDITFTPEHRATTSTGNIDIASGEPIPTEDLVRAKRFIQTQCCDGSVKVISFRRAVAPRLFGESCRSIRSDKFVPSEQTIEIQRSEARVMISPSVKSSPHPDDFRSAMQLGFMDTQGYDYRPLLWEE